MRFGLIQVVPRFFVGQLRVMYSMPGRLMPTMPMTLPESLLGSSLRKTSCTVATGVSSSPCTPATSRTRFPGFAPFATITGTYQRCPEPISTASKYRRWILPGSRASTSSRSMTGSPWILSPAPAATARGKAPRQQRSSNVGKRMVTSPEGCG